MKPNGATAMIFVSDKNITIPNIPQGANGEMISLKNENGSLRLCQYGQSQNPTYPFHYNAPFLDEESEMWKKNTKNWKKG